MKNIIVKKKSPAQERHRGGQGDYGRALLMMAEQLIKNKCDGCKNILLLHNKIMSCESCEKIVHAECAKYNFEYNHIINSWQCSDCTGKSTNRYNPFSAVLSDKHDPVQMSESGDIAQIYLIIVNHLTIKLSIICLIIIPLLTRIAPVFS